MDVDSERRTEKRLTFNWPIWFAEDFDDALSQGQMIDISSRGAAFTCYKDGSCPDLGQEITARFSVPRFGPDDSFDMANFTRSARVCQVDDVPSDAGSEEARLRRGFSRRVAIQFAEPLPFKPGEQPEPGTRSSKIKEQNAKLRMSSST
jgi:hypothetical protein